MDLPITTSTLEEDLAPLMELVWAWIPSDSRQDAYIMAFFAKYPHLHPAKPCRPPSIPCNELPCT